MMTTEEIGALFDENELLKSQVKILVQQVYAAQRNVNSCQRCKVLHRWCAALLGGYLTAGFFFTEPQSWLPEFLPKNFVAENTAQIYLFGIGMGFVPLALVWARDMKSDVAQLTTKAGFSPKWEHAIPFTPSTSLWRTRL